MAINPAIKAAARAILLKEIYKLGKKMESKNPFHPKTLAILGYADYFSPENDRPDQRFKNAIGSNPSDPSASEIKDTVLFDHSYIDNTYEVQLRTVLSEGWHEVDHDLRYKCQTDWNDQEDLQRAFNGVFVGLETSDWSTLMIFEKLSYRHYRNSNWHAMLRTKFRLRFKDDEIGDGLCKVLNEESEFSKKMFRLERGRFLKEIIRRDINVPFTLSNIVYLANCFFLGEDAIYGITPKLLLDDKSINRLAAKVA